MGKCLLNFIKTEIPWLLMALGLSVFLWMISMTLLDPEQNESYLRPLSLYNDMVMVTEGVVLLNPEALPDEIRVGVRAPASLHGLEAGLEIIPSIDFRAITRQMVHDADRPITLDLPVSVNAPLEFVVHHVYPSAVTLMFDAFVRASFLVTVHEIGVIAPGLELQRVWTANTSVMLSGPRSVINEVVGVYVVADLNGLAENTTSTMPILAVNAEGHDMSHLLEFNISETTLNIEVLPVKRVEIVPQITGTLAAGFIVSQYTTNPAYVYLTGVAERLAEIEALSPVFDLEQENEDFERVFSLRDWLPEGVQLAQSTLPGAHLSVTVEPIQERTFTIMRGNIGVFGGAQYTIVDAPTHITVRIAGPASRVREMTVADINVALNLGGRTAGTHRVPLQFALPPGIHVVGAVPVWDVHIDDPDTTNNANGVVDPPPYTPDPTEPPTSYPDPTDPEPPIEPPYDPPTYPYPYPPTTPPTEPPYDYPPYDDDNYDTDLPE